MVSTCPCCPFAASPRADFATDEEWTRYKEQKETLPRAAFQFGVKRADGRKSHKELEKVGRVRVRREGVGGRGVVAWVEAV